MATRESGGRDGALRGLIQFLKYFKAWYLDQDKEQEESTAEKPVDSHLIE